MSDFCFPDYIQIFREKSSPVKKRLLHTTGTLLRPRTGRIHEHSFKRLDCSCLGGGRNGLLPPLSDGAPLALLRFSHQSHPLLFRCFPQQSPRAGCPGTGDTDLRPPERDQRLSRGVCSTGRLIVVDTTMAEVVHDGSRVKVTKSFPSSFLKHFRSIR